VAAKVSRATSQSISRWPTLGLTRYRPRSLSQFVIISREVGEN